MFERFTDRARRVLVLAQEEARMLGHDVIGTEHLLLGLVREGEGVAAQALESLGVTLGAVRGEVEAVATSGGSIPLGSLRFAGGTKTAVEQSRREAERLGHDHVGAEHLLLALIRQDESAAVRVLRTLGTDPVAVRRQVVAILHGTGSTGYGVDGRRVDGHRVDGLRRRRVPGRRATGSTGYGVDGYRGRRVPGRSAPDLKEPCRSRLRRLRRGHPCVVGGRAARRAGRRSKAASPTGSSPCRPGRAAMTQCP